MLKVYQAKNKTKIKLPMFVSSISAGFPSPAEDFVENELDLNEFLIKHPAATFFVKVKGDSMLNAAISDGDILVVDRSLDPGNNSIVIAFLDGEFRVKRICVKGKEHFLWPENPKYQPIKITDEMDFKIWGLVTFIIKKAH
jgi:DNA polymerase V